MAASPISKILTSLSQNNEPVHISGLEGTSAGYLLNRLITESKQMRTLVVCSTEDRATELHQNFLTFQQTLFGSERRNAPESRVLPQWEQNPTSAIQPSIRVQFERMRVLGSLLSAPTRNIIFSTNEALSQRIPNLKTDRKSVV